MALTAAHAVNQLRLRMHTHTHTCIAEGAVFERFSLPLLCIPVLLRINYNE